MTDFEEIRAIATPIALQLRWSDQDINGHMNNVQILTLMEEARIRATQQWTATTPGSSGPKRIARALNTSFEREVQYGKDTTVWVWVTRIGHSSFVFGHILSQDGQPCAYTEATMVVIDAETGKPRPHDERFQKELEVHLGPPFTAH